MTTLRDRLQAIIESDREAIEQIRLSENELEENDKQLPDEMTGWIVWRDDREAGEKVSNGIQIEGRS